MVSWNRSRRSRRRGPHTYPGASGAVLAGALVLMSSACELEESPTSPSQAAEAPASLSIVGSPGEGPMVTFAMNESGHLAGSVEFAGDIFRALGSTVATREGTFGGLTDDGTVVFYRQILEADRLFRWNPDGTETLISLRPEWVCFAEIRVDAVGERRRSVAPNGVIFATMQGWLTIEGCPPEPSGAGEKRLIRWTLSGGWAVLGIMGGMQLDAVSDNGEVAALSRAAGGGSTEIFRWTEATGVESLGVLPGGGRAADVNNAGVVVGANQSNTGIWRSTPSGELEGLASGLHPFINNDGDIAYLLGLPGKIAIRHSDATIDTIKKAWLPGSGPPVALDVSYASHLGGFNDRDEVFGTLAVSNPEPMQVPFVYRNGFAHVLDSFGGSLGRTVASTSGGEIGGTVWNPGQPARWTAPPTPTAPAKPTGLGVRATSDTQMEITWTDASSNEADFTLQRRIVNSNGTVGPYVLVTRPAANSTSHVDGGLVTGTGYQYRLAACNAVGCSPYATASTVVAAVAPIAPGPLNRVVVAGPAVRLTWQDKSNNETDFQLTRRQIYPDGTSSLYTEIARPGANSVAYNDPGVVPGATYMYRIRACNTSVCSALVTSTSVTLQTIPLAPTNAAVVQTSGTGISFTWTDASANERDFSVSRRTSDHAGGWGPETEVGRPLANKQSFSQTGLTRGETYQYLVRSCNYSGCSAAASAVVTMELAPAAPTALITTGAAAGQFNLSWTDQSSNEAYFELQRSRKSGGVWGASQVVTQTAAGVTTYLDTGLVSGSQYLYKVRACNIGGCSTFATGVARTAP
jgi:hypothetical protein